MAWFPRFPEGISRLRKFNTLLVALITACLLAQRFFQHTPEVVAQLEIAVTVGGIALAGGLVAQFIINRRGNKRE